MGERRSIGSVDQPSCTRRVHRAFTRTNLSDGSSADVRYVWRSVLSQSDAEPTAWSYSRELLAPRPVVNPEPLQRRKPKLGARHLRKSGQSVWIILAQHFKNQSRQAKASRQTGRPENSIRLQSWGTHSPIKVYLSQVVIDLDRDEILFIKEDLLTGIFE